MARLEKPTFANSFMDRANHRGEKKVDDKIGCETKNDTEDNTEKPNEEEYSPSDQEVTFVQPEIH